MEIYKSGPLQGSVVDTEQWRSANYLIVRDPIGDWHLYSKRTFDDDNLLIAHSGRLPLKTSPIQKQISDSDLRKNDFEELVKKTYFHLLALSHYFLVALVVENLHSRTAVTQVLPAAASFPDVYEIFEVARHGDFKQAEYCRLSEPLEWYFLCGLPYCLKQNEAGDLYLHARRTHTASNLKEEQLVHYGPLHVEITPITATLAELMAEPETVVHKVCRRLRQASASLATAELCIEAVGRFSQTFGPAVEYGAVRDFVHDCRSELT